MRTAARRIGPSRPGGSRWCCKIKLTGRVCQRLQESRGGVSISGSTRARSRAPDYGVTHLMHLVAVPLLVVWYGLPSHRSRVVRDVGVDTKGRPTGQLCASSSAN